MSDSEDSGGSDDDGFDEEAERERLREKYERDKQRREATQKMSELLLQGATMTNRHCEECGSPIFRYDGEEFCPSCGGTTDVDQDATAADAAGDAGTADEAGATGEVGTTDDEGTAGGAGTPREADSADASQPADVGREDAGRAADAGRDGRGDRPRAGDGRDSGAGRVRSSDRSDRPESLAPERSVRPDPSELQAGADASTTDDVPTRSRGPSGGLQGAAADEAPSLAQARASLRRAIVSLSEQAAQSDDPVRAKNLLEAANEGAEALAELGGDEV